MKSVGTESYRSTRLDAGLHFLASVPIRFLSSGPTLTSSEDRDILGGEAKTGFRGDAGRVPKPRAEKDILILNRDRSTTLHVNNAAEKGAPHLQNKRGTLLYRRFLE